MLKTFFASAFNLKTFFRLHVLNIEEAVVCLIWTCVSGWRELSEQMIITFYIFGPYLEIIFKFFETQIKQLITSIQKLWWKKFFFWCAPEINFKQHVKLSWHFLSLGIRFLRLFSLWKKLRQSIFFSFSSWTIWWHCFPNGWGILAFGWTLETDHKSQGT